MRHGNRRCVNDLLLNRYECYIYFTTYIINALIMKCACAKTPFIVLGIVYAAQNKNEEGMSDMLKCYLCFIFNLSDFQVRIRFLYIGDIPTSQLHILQLTNKLYEATMKTLRDFRVSCKTSIDKRTVLKCSLKDSLQLYASTSSLQSLQRSLTTNKSNINITKASFIWQSASFQVPHPRYRFATLR